MMDERVTATVTIKPREGTDASEATFECQVWQSDIYGGIQSAIAERFAWDAAILFPESADTVLMANH